MASILLAQRVLHFGAVVVDHTGEAKKQVTTGGMAVTLLYLSMCTSLGDAVYLWFSSLQRD